jgi:hypothetical protein
MRRLKAHRPSPALALAFVALLVALGGTSYAVVNLPANSVGKKQLKRNAVTSVKVKNGSLLRKDFKSGQVPAGPAGPTGPQGAQGPAGPVNVTVRSGPMALGTSTANCGPGERAVGGGGFTPEADAFLYDSSPPNPSGTPTSWDAGAQTTGGLDAEVQAFAICAS